MSGFRGCKVARSSDDLMNLVVGGIVLVLAVVYLPTLIKNLSGGQTSTAQTAINNAGNLLSQAFGLGNSSLPSSSVNPLGTYDAASPLATGGAVIPPDNTSLPSESNLPVGSYAENT